MADVLNSGSLQVLRLDSKDYIGVLESGGIDGNLDAKVLIASCSCMCVCVCVCVCLCMCLRECAITFSP